MCFWLSTFELVFDFEEDDDLWKLKLYPLSFTSYLI
jgi:hypothetical protein